MLNIGDIITIWDEDTNFEEELRIRNDLSLSDFIEDAGWYKITDIDDEQGYIWVQNATHENVPAWPVYKDDYLFLSRTELTRELLIISDKKLAIINKIQQLYRKHNNGNSTFKFQGV